ncbi:hypothetical protein IIB49_00385 [Patescibacteria group bacterium]|nr:hypothetical protein [Patescibacteria group bacterium]
MEKEIHIIKSSITKQELKQIAKETFGDLVKAVVDLEQGIMALGGELHADEEVVLMEQEGSKRENTWGINLLPEESEDAFIQFDSMINLKPAFGNSSRTVESEEIQEKIKALVRKLIKE